EPLLQLGEAAGAAVADRRYQVLEHVAENRSHRAASRHRHFHPFRAKRLAAKRRRAAPATPTPPAPSASTSAASRSSTSSRSTIASSDAIPRNTLKGTRTVLWDSATTTGC